MSLSEYIDYPRWPQLAEESLRIDVRLPEKVKVGEKELTYSKKFRGIVISGMGGSGIAGDIVRDTLQDMIDIPIIVNKDLHLPSYVNDDYLVVAISYSGNTAETIRCYESCIEKGIPVITISTGGKLRELAERNGTPHITIPKATAPRYGLPCLLYSCLRAVGKALSIEDKVLSLAENSINYMRKALDDYPTRFKALADKLANKFTMIYTPSPIASLGVRFKNDMNENAKQPVAVCIIPESEHNDLAIHIREIENLEILVVDAPSIRNTEHGVHVTALMKVLEELGRRFHKIELEGDSRLSEIVYGVTGLGMLTIDIARIVGVDPVKIEAIDRVKKYVTSRS
ncbi:MAG: bifunctional phosphoglucose/phosphomannose isomerase [Crenarchaeota archaeon]|nr:bifunctional phosphoglucose/phosphomannose isomerase [Thermoproteota archaeon]